MQDPLFWIVPAASIVALAFFFAVTAVFLTGFFWAVWFCAKGASEKVIAMMNNKIRFISYIKNPCSIISNS